MRTDSSLLDIKFFGIGQKFRGKVTENVTKKALEKFKTAYSKIFQTFADLSRWTSH
jgi:hypothetical protein